MTRGRVSGTGNDRRWYIDKVTFADEGTYTQRDYWNKEISTVKVAITPRHNYVKRIPGETLYISLEGLDLADAHLFFSGEANVTLVHDGAPVSQDIPDYWDRVKTHSMNIEIKDVNTSDVGRYTLMDRRNRVVSITRMDLTDHHEDGANPLLALLLLLGIPAGICCCCRKKIFRQKASTTATLQNSPETVHLPPTGPAGPPPAYHTPGDPGAMYYHDPNMAPVVHPPPNPAVPGQWNGPPPVAGFNPAYPPQNPMYPPVGPAMVPPGQPPQWNGPPPGQYPPGPGAPMGYAPAPVMYSAAPPTAASEPVKEELKMENMASSPAEPLLTTPPQADSASSPVAPVPPSSTNVPTSSDAAYQFQIDAGKPSSTNFL
ncbi:uncharacterized protein, partial [Centroberyx affinis]|uniref:uncharacterized protein n=1 Tax=Centroberyx affinis TaxID=166261 RepID=UPI003A5BB33A